MLLVSFPVYLAQVRQTTPVALMYDSASLALARYLVTPGMIKASRAKTLSITPMIERIRPATAAPLKYAFFFAMPAIEKIVPKSPVRNGIPGNQHNTTVSIPIMSPATAIPLGRFAGAGSTAGADAEGSGTGAPQLEQTVRLLGIYEPHLLQYMIVTCLPLTYSS